MAVWGVVLLLDLLAVFAVTGLGFDDGLGRVFASGSVRNQDYQALAGQFTPSEGDTVVLFESPDFADPDHLQIVSDFVIEASFLDGVVDVFSLFALRAPGESGGPGAPVMPIDVPRDGSLAETLDQIAANAAGGGRLVSEDRTLTAAIVATDAAAVPGGTRAILDAMRTIAAKLVEGTDVTFSVSGLPAVRFDIVDSLFTDLIRLNALGMIAGFAICVLALRSVRLAFLVSLPAGTALLWALGAISALGFGINVLSIALPVLILVLAFADSLHLAFEVRRLAPQIPAPDTLALRALRRVGPACALASITTAIAFGGLLISDSIIVRDFGVAGIVAALAALVAVLVVQPLVFATAGRLVPPQALFPPHRARAVFDWRFLPELALRHPTRIAIGALCVIVACGAIYTAIIPTYSVLENINRDAPPVRALETMNTELVPINTIDIPIAIDAADGIDETALARIAATHRTVAGAAPEAVAVSLHSLVPSGPDQSLAARAERAARLLSMMSESQRGRLISEDGRLALVRLHVDTYQARDIRVITERVEAALAADPLAVQAAGRPTGFMVMSSFISAGMILDLNYCFFIAVLASGLLTTLWFANWRYGLVALVPNVLPILVVGAWLVVSGRGLQFSSGIALTVAFGIAVDDTVHIINRLKLNAPRHKPFDPEAIHRSVLEVTPALVVTTAVLSFGLLSTFSSASPMIGYFGVLSIAVFILAILADLVVLPACLMLLHRLGKQPRTRGGPPEETP